MIKSTWMIGMSALAAGLGLLAAPTAAPAQDSVFVTATGNVGIGTANPAAKLEVSGGEVRLPPGQGGTGFTHFNFMGNGQNYIRGTTVLADNGGNVGIGTAYPGAALHVASGEVRLPGGTGSANGWPTHFRFQTDGRNYIRGTTLIADDGGDVGIGTTSPSAKLHVSGAAGTTKALVQETSSTAAAREILEIRNNGGPVFILEDTSVPQRWAQGTGGANFVLDEQAHAGTEYTFTNTGNLTIAGVLTQGSSRDLKTDFASLNPKDVLTRVSALPVSLWSYKSDNGIRHIGPMAEDFHQAFGLGEDDKHIAPGDQAGVALLAVQGLNQVLQSKAEEIATLQHENADLTRRIEALEALLSKVMKTAQAQPILAEED